MLGLEMDFSIILPVLAATSVVLLLIEKVYYKIREKFSIKVNCWFCNTNTNVPYNSSNSWYCPHCDQYNGFTSDGSYNRVLQDQFNEKLNRGSWCRKTESKSPPSNGLCHFCNINLQLKVQQLAGFIPFNKNNYDEEVQQYSDRLDRVYRLCGRCDAVLDKTLKEKYKTFVTDQNHPFISKFDNHKSQLKPKNRHPAYLCLSSLLSFSILLLALPFDWHVHLEGLIEKDFVPEYLCDYMLNNVLPLVQPYLQSSGMTTVLLSSGVIIHVVDYCLIRDYISFVNLFLWIITLSLTYVPIQTVNHKHTILMVASVITFLSSLAEYRKHKEKSVATVKPVQLHKFENKPTVAPHTFTAAPKNGDRELLRDNAKNSNYSIPDRKFPSPVPFHIHESTSDDFGFSKLNVSNSRRVTRSQTKHFQTKLYSSQPSTSKFKTKSVNITPPKLQFEHDFDRQPTLTRTSSNSSGFISLSHQKMYDEVPPSIAGEELDSVSQVGQNAVMPYQTSPFNTSTQFSHPYMMPVSHFPPSYTVMTFSPTEFNKFYQYSHMSHYESPLNFSTVNGQNQHEKSCFQVFKSVLSSILFLFLITSNVAILWKVFGTDFFNKNT